MKERLISIDVLRGLTVLMMTIVNNPGSWSTVFPPLLHAEWNGCTPTDLVFPFFVFIMGAAIPLAIPTKKFDGEMFEKILTRSLRIICLGLFLNFFNSIEILGLTGISLLVIRLLLTFAVGYALMGNFSAKVKLILALVLFSTFLILAYSGISSFTQVRLPGVLQRIGIVYFFATLLYLLTSTKKQFITIAILLLGYWALMTLVPIPGMGHPNLNAGTNLATWVDTLFLENHMYIATKTWDPEGVLSTLPAIATGLLGVIIGQTLGSSVSQNEKAKKMGLISLILIVSGLLWSLVFPLNKSLWTSSYVLFTAGLATLFLTILYYIIDIKKIQKGTKPFLMWGVNPMLVFFASGIIPRSLAMIQFPNPKLVGETINLQRYLYEFWIAPLFSNPMMASLAGALIYVLIWHGILYLFYQNKKILKV
jgi:predicted acyltransferase